MNNLYFVQLFKKNVFTCYIFVSHNVNIAGADSGGGHTRRAPPPKIGKNMIFLGVKYPQNFARPP